MRTLLTTAAALALAAAPAFAQSASSDQQFAHNAASGGKTEVTLGQYAADHAQDSGVKAFGQRMVTDHTAANARLEQIAKTANIQLPSSPDHQDQAMIDRLEKLKGAAFDREYVRDMVQDHQKDVQEFQKEAQSGSNPQLKAFAQETLPTLQQHLQMAQQLESKMGSAHSSAAPAR